MSLSTVKAQVFKEVDIPIQEVIDWGISMLENGHDSSNLRILAGLTSLNNREEVIYYVEQTLRDLNLPTLQGKEALLVYVANLLQDLIEGYISNNEAVGRISRLYIKWGYLQDIADFYLLENALHDLECDDFQYYWKDATKSNISTIIKEQAEKWLETYNSSVETKG